MNYNFNGDILKNSSELIDGDVTVQINIEYDVDDLSARTTFSDPISLKDFIANCEAGNVYAVGTMAKINNLIEGQAYRFLLIGVNHDILCRDETQKAKTTWNFVEVPLTNVHLGLPFNIYD